MANFFDQFDTTASDGPQPNGALRVTVHPRQEPSPYADAISNVESGGNYRAIGPATRTGDRAVGKYQVMSSNIPSWTKEVLGREMSPSEFHRDDAAQDAVFNAKFGGYVDKYGPEGAAKAWFAGERGMNNPNARDVLGTSVADYAAKFSKNAPLTDVSAQSRNDVAQAPAAVGPNFFDRFDTQAKGQVDRRFPEQDALIQSKYLSDPGAAAAGIRGAINGVTFNFADELKAMKDAGGDFGITNLNPILHGAVKYWMGDKDTVKKYEESVAAERAATKQAEDQHPTASMAGNLAGALAVPIPGLAAAKGATFAGRAANAALTGSIIGGLSGVGEGEGATDSASKGLVGGSVGGAIGGFAAPVVEGLTRGVTAAIAKPVNIIRSAINPQGAAERAVGRAYQDAQRIDPAATNRLTPAEMTAGAPATVMDTLGAGGRDLARSAANSSGEARDVLNRTLDPRFEEQGARLTNWLKSTFNYPDVHAQQAAIDQAAKTVNKGTYARAMNDPAAQSLWDEGFQQIIQAPVVQEAMKGATRTAANRATMEGFTPVKNPFVFGSDGRLTMKDGMTPNLAYWDAVKRNLDDKIGTLQRAGEKSAAADAIQLKSYLVDHLDELVPAYGKARAGAAAFFKAGDALEAGQNYVTQNFATGETRVALAKMQPHERNLFQDGFVSRFIETIDKVPDRADVVRRIYNSPAAKEKIEIAIGPQRAKELESMLRVENIMQQSLRSVQGNSTTVQQLVGLGLAGAAGGGVLGYDPTSSGIAAALATVGKKGIDRRVAEQVAKMLTSNDPKLLQRGMQMVARSEKLLSVLRAADTGVARVGGQQAPNGLIPALQAPVASRADENQPTIPRPPGQ